MRLTAVYMKVPEGYVGFVEELPGANTQGETLEEARANLEEAVSMVLDASRELSEKSLEGAEVIRETLILPAAWQRTSFSEKSRYIPCRPRLLVTLKDLILNQLQSSVPKT